MEHGQKLILVAAAMVSDAGRDTEQHNISFCLSPARPRPQISIPDDDFLVEQWRPFTIRCTAELYAVTSIELFQEFANNNRSK